AGRFTHVDAHIVVPEFWSVEEAHERTDAFERRLLDECRIEGEIAFHTDPCRRLFCKVCDLSDCPIRAAAFERRPILTLEEATQPDLAPGQPPPVLA
ncbi:MAG: cation transporter, partial [Candidatus Eisenbacteria bacterium]|nr:cation transporter [Candidatus Eisenbacteria bacterium]